MALSCARVKRARVILFVVCLDEVACLLLLVSYRQGSGDVVDVPRGRRRPAPYLCADRLRSAPRAARLGLAQWWTSSYCAR